MKGAFVFLLFLLAIQAIQAQPAGYNINEKSTVLDTSGKVVPFDVWYPRYQLGTYGLEATHPQDPNTTFVLVRLHQNAYSGVMKKLPMPRKSSSFTAGKKFGSFEETDINGQVISSKKAKGKILVFYFWFINCGTCQLAIPELNDLVAAYKDNDSVQFIAVAWDRKYTLQEFLKKTPFHYINIADGFLPAKQYCHIDAYPTHVVVDQEGKVYFHTTGLLPNTVYWIKKSIDELLAQPATPQN